MKNLVQKFRAKLLAATAVALVIPLGFSVVSPAAAASSKPKSGGNLTILQVGLSWPDMDPANPSVGGVRMPMFTIMYDGLWTQNASGQVVGDLATSWNYNSSGTVLDIDLRHGVKFQDGTPFNAQAVIFNFQRASSTSQNSQCLPFFQNVTSTSQVNNYEVAVHFNVAFTAFPADMSAAACSMIISPTAYATYGTSYGLHPVGTGPFSFGSMVVNSSVNYVRNNSYWGGRPYLGSITLETVGSDESAVDAVKAGTAQAFVVNPDPQDVVLAKQLKLDVYYSQPTSVAYVKLDMKTAPFNNLTARQAIAYAINQRQITKVLYSNKYSPDSSLYLALGPKAPGYPTYNLQKAKQLVSEIPGGLTFQLQCIDSPSQIQLATVIESQLDAAGMNVAIDPLQTTSLYAGWHAFTYQAGLSSWTGTAPDYTYFYNFYGSSAQNLTGINDPVLNNLIAQARETVKTVNQKALWLRVQTQEDKDITWAPMFAEGDYYIESPKLHNLAASGLGVLDVAQTWLS